MKLWLVCIWFMSIFDKLGLWIRSDQSFDLIFGIFQIWSKFWFDFWNFPNLPIIFGCSNKGFVRGVRLLSNALVYSTSHIVLQSVHWSTWCEPNSCKSYIDLYLSIRENLCFFLPAAQSCYQIVAYSFLVMLYFLEVNVFGKLGRMVLFSGNLEEDKLLTKKSWGRQIKMEGKRKDW